MMMIKARTANLGTVYTILVLWTIPLCTSIL